jgi:hypothetical protein
MDSEAPRAISSHAHMLHQCNTGGNVEQQAHKSHSTDGDNMPDGHGKFQQQGIANKKRKLNQGILHHASDLFRGAPVKSATLKNESNNWFRPEKQSRADGHCNKSCQQQKKRQFPFH